MSSQESQDSNRYDVFNHKIWYITLGMNEQISNTKALRYVALYMWLPDTFLSNHGINCVVMMCNS